ncbi:MAG TPA: T9SS type A sorting domain-containing protein [Ignavibacteriaceae bacterium]|nr:T9SS type A sorting domain-containing protein [Ignavibacteriaceae bacterium]
MNKSFRSFLLWCMVVFLSVSIFAQEKTILNNNIFSAANKHNNSYSPNNNIEATTLRWDNGVNDDAIGLTNGGTFQVAASFPASMMGAYTGQSLTQVIIYINDVPNPCVLKVYDQGTPTTPGTLLYSQTLTVTAASWNTITLATPVSITGNDIWVGYECTHTGGTYPAGCDAGPAVVNGDWVYLNGAWSRLYDASAGEIDVNWNIAAVVEQLGPPCPVQTPENPTPANNAVNVPITGVNLSWSNGGPGTVAPTQVEVFFGPAGNMTSVYSGAPITNWAVPGSLNYFTNYQWKVVNKIDTCNISSSTWAFKTVQDPNLHEYCEPFDNLSNWTVVGPLGMTNWNANPTNSAGGTAPELRLNWSPSFTGKSLIRSNTIPVNLLNNWFTSFSFRFYLRWYGNPSGTATVSITYDGGVTEEVLYQVVNPTGNVGPMLVEGTFTTPATGSENAQIQIWYDGNSLSGIWEIFWDDLCLGQVIPVELTSFTAIGSTNQVELNWTTATELNNNGFQIERSNGSEYRTVGFVAGHGTSTNVHNYTFVDQNVEAGSYSYRLKQIDLDGTFEYSNTIEVEVLGLREFALGQNYPNPFNPSTTINFSLAVDSKVSLKVFNVLGQEVASLVNGQMSAGSQKISFDASSLNSGVYFYRLDADGIDGQKFSSTKKMILTK